MVRRKTDEQFKQEVYNLVGNKYVFLDVYINKRTKLRVKHNECGNTYEVEPSNFLRGRRCPYCFGTLKKTDAQFKREVKNVVGDEYEFLEPYQGSLTKIKVKHSECGNIYKVAPSNFLKGTRCPFCQIRDRSKTDAQFKKEVYDSVGGEYTFLGPYINNSTKIKVRHNKCRNTYEVRPNDFLNGRRCPYCAGHIKKTNAQFKKEVSDLVGDEYKFLDSYVNNNTKLRVKHCRCGNIYSVSPSNFKQGYRCPYCSSPKGEDIINKILKTMGIEYKYQKTFDDLKDTNLLSYDFYIPDQGILIEYQGIQHYQPIDVFGGEDQFKLQQKHDRMKADYAKSHNYHLIAVPYTEDTFSKIKKYLLHHGLTK